ncbi:MAG: glycosyltransferase family 4 protein [Candidatus Limnocylindria bacterium]
MLSWRYMGHPQAGGAELVTHRVLTRMVADGHVVTAFTAAHPGAPEQETIDGVRIMRRGRQWTVHLEAWRWLRRRLGEFDRVVEQINTLPFLTPLYVPEAQRRLLIHQLAREYWWRETRGLFRLVAPLGYVLEPYQFRFYRRTDTMTISESSRADLASLGIPRERISVIPMATDVVPVEGLEPKPRPPRCIVIGRLTPAKFVEEGLAAFEIIQAHRPEVELDIVGTGDPRYRVQLENIVAQRGLRNVVFHGRVDDARRRTLLARATVHLFTSHREGWGLTVTEAAAMGTPSVGYDAPGVRDSIADPRLIAAGRSPTSLAARAIGLLDDPEAYETARHRAWAQARELGWDRTAAAFLRAIR